TPTTRLMRCSPVSCGSRPTNVSAARTASDTGLSSCGAGGGSQPPGSLNTTTSPRCTSNAPGTSRDTMTRSPSTSVSSMDALGMKNACTRKVLMRSDRTSALTTMMAVSRRSDPLRAGRCSRAGSSASARWSARSSCGDSASSRPPSAARSVPASGCGPRGGALSVTRSQCHLGPRSGKRDRPADGVHDDGGRPGGTAAVVRAERRGCRSASGRGLALLLDLRLLAAQRAQVVQLGATHVTARHDRDRLDGRRVHGERALDADAEADLADGERLADPAALAGDDDALERLDAGAVALDDLDVDLERVTGTELRDVAAQRCCVDAVQRVHDASPRPPQVGRVLVARERRA